MRRGIFAERGEDVRASAVCLERDARQVADTLRGANRHAERGRRPPGTLVGSIADGRILIGIEGLNGASFAYIDATGVHEIATEPDRTMAHGVWASPDTIVFDSERAGSRHLFRMAIGDGVVTRMTTGSGQERASVSSDGQRVVSDNFDPSSNDRDLGLRTWSLAGVAIDAVTSPGDAAGVSGATPASFPA